MSCGSSIAAPWHTASRADAQGVEGQPGAVVARAAARGVGLLVVARLEADRGPGERGGHRGGPARRVAVGRGGERERAVAVVADRERERGAEWDTGEQPHLGGVRAGALSLDDDVDRAALVVQHDERDRADGVGAVDLTDDHVGLGAGQLGDGDRGREHVLADAREERGEAVQLGAGVPGVGRGDARDGGPQREAAVAVGHEPWRCDGGRVHGGRVALAACDRQGQLPPRHAHRPARHRGRGRPGADAGCP